MTIISGKITLSGNPILSGPEMFDFTADVSSPAPPIPGNFNLTTADKPSSPSDIASWPETVRITGIKMRAASDPQPGLHFTFDHTLPDNWKFYTDPPGPDNYQYTVWAGHDVTIAAFIQMWQGRPNTGAPILTDFHTNWAYSSRWGALNSYFPKVGDTMVFMVSAGNARDQKSPTSVRERSNLVSVILPVNDNGDFTF